MKAIRKDNVTPEQWAHRLAVQRARRARPEVRERERKRERERWPTSNKKKRANEYQRARRAAGYYKPSDERRKARRATDLEFRERLKASIRASYAKNPDYYRAHVAKHRERVSPCYAASVLKVPVSQLTPELIELVRAHLFLKRELRKQTK